MAKNLEFSILIYFLRNISIVKLGSFSSVGADQTNRGIRRSDTPTTFDFWHCRPISNIYVSVWGLISPTFLKIERMNFDNNNLSPSLVKGILRKILSSKRYRKKFIREGWISLKQKIISSNSRIQYSIKYIINRINIDNKASSTGSQFVYNSVI